MKKYIINQLKQPSTWRGLVLIATSAGVAITPQMGEAIVAGGLALAGIIGAVVPD
jgi:hypothetical protein